MNLLNHPFCIFSTQDLNRLVVLDDQYPTSKKLRRFMLVHEYENPKTGKVEVWKVKPDIERGFPGPLDQDVLVTVLHLVSKSIEEHGEIPQPLYLPSWRGMCRLMRKSYNYTTLIKESVRRIANTTIDTDTFYVKSKDGKQMRVEGTTKKEQSINIWSYEGEHTDLNGSLNGSGWIWLDSLFAKSIETFNLRPFDYEYYVGLPPLAKRIYLIQGRKFFGLRDNDYTREFYLPFCNQLPLVPQKYVADAKKGFRRAHQALEETGFLEKVDWICDRRRNPMEIHYYPGERAWKEIEEGKRRKSLATRFSHSWKTDEIQMITAWKTELASRLDDPQESNAGYFIKLGRLIVSGKIPEAKVWHALGLAKEVKELREMKKNLSAVFTDQLRRQLGITKDEFQNMLNSV